jgi:hypothetical protein
MKSREEIKADRAAWDCAHTVIRDLAADAVASGQPISPDEFADKLQLLALAADSEVAWRLDHMAGKIRQIADRVRAGEDDGLGFVSQYAFRDFLRKNPRPVADADSAS